jgi:hypothetical protein
MKLRRAIINVLFGSCVIIATQQVNAEMPMDDWDLDHFQPDCSKKREQVEWLQSFRNSDGQRLSARVEQFVTPWRWFTDYEEARRVSLIGRGDYNWLINQHLMTLRNNCL